jgi:uracil-DNA glycosylase
MRVSWKLLINLDKLSDGILDGVDLNNICPKSENIFECFKYFEVDECNVVIIGQDPYYTVDECGDPIANGLAFSQNISQSGLNKIPPSLLNIFKCLVNTGMINSIDVNSISTDFRCIARQNVLLMNRYLTTNKGKALCHKQWGKFTAQIIKRLIEFKISNKQHIIFLLWGSEAHKLIDDSVNSEYIVKLKWCHPSPLAQTTLSEDKKFINCDHFVKCNELLIKFGKLPINYNVLVPSSVDVSAKHTTEISIDNKIVTELPVTNKNTSDSENYAIKQIKNSNNSETDRILFGYTDGSCFNNGYKNAKARYGLCIVENNKIIYEESDVVLGVTIKLPCRVTKKNPELTFKDVYFPPSSSRAELLGMCRILEMFKKIPQIEKCKIRIVSDSTYCINTVTEWIYTWFEKKTVNKMAHPDLINRIYNCLLYFKNNHHTDDRISFIHINSHTSPPADKNSLNYQDWFYNDYIDKICDSNK